MDFETSRLLQEVAAKESYITSLQNELSCAKQKIVVYERFLHQLQLFAEVALDGNKVRKLIDRACTWSYAHRAGNGELTETEQQARIGKAFEKLTDLDD